jgi:hypothetical protein
MTEKPAAMAGFFVLAVGQVSHVPPLNLQGVVTR